MKTNIFKKAAILSLLAGSVLLASCTDDFQKINTDPDIVLKVDPVSLLFKAELHMSTAGATWNDSYRYKIRWMQYCTGIWGFGTSSQYIAGFGGGLYDEYNEVGKYVTHMDYLISINENPEKYSDLSQVARILLIAKAVQTADTQGSLAYTHAWKTRVGDDVSEVALNPKFEAQEDLYPLWNSQLKDCVQKLKGKVGSQDQASLKGPDRSYNGNIQGWIKAANAIRLRIATRLMKRMPELSNEIAKEVLAPDNADYVMSGIDDSFLLYYDNTFPNYNGGDWHSVKDMDRAAAPFMKYLKKYNDPRKEIFFQQNNLTTENVAAYNADKENKDRQIPSTYSRWEGGTVNPDLTAEDPIYISRNWKITPKKEIDMRVMNKPQTRLWKGSDDNGAGGFYHPIMTYADFCFVAAEFVQTKQIASKKTAEEWYNDGVRNSIRQWNKLADYCKIYDYETMGDKEMDTIIDEFIAQDDIKWNAAKGAEQIYTQAWVEHYKNNNESWAQWKRVGYPNINDANIIKFDFIQYKDGSIPVIPRKVRYSPVLAGQGNYENIMERYKQMTKYEEFGGLENEHGRLWWEGAN